MSEKKKKAIKSKKKSFDIRDLVGKCLQSPKVNKKEFWAKEIVLLKRLLEKYPNTEFWKKATLKVVPSFAIYLTTEDRYIAAKYQEFLFQPETPKDEIIIAEKVGEDYNKEIKPKTVKDFLK